MNRSSNASDSALGVTVKLTEAPDGKFVAQAVGNIGKIVGPISGRTASEAMNLHSEAVNKASSTGKI